MRPIPLLFLILLAVLLGVVAVQKADHLLAPRVEFTGRVTRLLDGTEYGHVSGAAPGAPRYYALIRPTDGSQDSTGPPWCVGLNDSAAFCALVENQVVRCRIKDADGRWATFVR